MKLKAIRHALIVVATGLPILIPAMPASADPGRTRFEWVRARTVQGCFIYWHWIPALETEADVVENATFSYDGTGCRPDSILNGEGTLTMTRRYPPSPYRETQTWRGRFVNGAREGEFSDLGGVVLFDGGCVVGLEDQADCTPIGRTRFAEGGSAGGADPASSSAPVDTPTPASASEGDVFDRCTRLEGPDQRGIQMMWELRNVCSTRISLSYCLRADFEAAGDYNLCTRREYKTHSVAPGATVHFAFNLMPPGSNLADGRQVTHNSLYVRGYACADDSSPRVHFNDGQFVFRGC